MKGRKLPEICIKLAIYVARDREFVVDKTHDANERSSATRCTAGGGGHFGEHIYGSGPGLSLRIPPAGLRQVGESRRRETSLVGKFNEINAALYTLNRPYRATPRSANVRSDLAVFLCSLSRPASLGSSGKSLPVTRIHDRIRNLAACSYRGIAFCRRR